MPFIAGNLGGGTLANKVAHQIDENRAAAERADNEDAAPPYTPSDNAPQPTYTDAGAFDDDGPSWPDEAAERAYLASLSTPSAPSDSSAPSESEDEHPANLPSLDSLTARISPETHQLLENLFRAKFTDVRKFPEKLLKKKK